MPQTSRQIAKSQSTGTTSQSNKDYHATDRGIFRDALWAEYQKDCRAIVKLWKQGHVLSNGKVFTEEMSDRAILIRYKKYKDDLDKYAPPKKERGGVSRVLISADAQAALDAMFADRGEGVSILDKVEETPEEEVPEDGEGDPESE